MLIVIVERSSLFLRIVSYGIMLYVSCSPVGNAPPMCLLCVHLELDLEAFAEALSRCLSNAFCRQVFFSILACSKLCIAMRFERLHCAFLCRYNNCHRTCRKQQAAYVKSPLWLYKKIIPAQTEKAALYEYGSVNRCVSTASTTLIETKLVIMLATVAYSVDCSLEYFGACTRYVDDSLTWSSLLKLDENSCSGRLQVFWHRLYADFLAFCSTTVLIPTLLAVAK